MSKLLSRIARLIECKGKPLHLFYAGRNVNRLIVYFLQYLVNVRGGYLYIKFAALTWIVPRLFVCMPNSIKRNSFRFYLIFGALLLALHVFLWKI